jgi:hypothetical protein
MAYLLPLPQDSRVGFIALIFVALLYAQARSMASAELAAPCDYFGQAKGGNSLYAKYPMVPRCERVKIPSLRAEVEYFRSAIACYPVNPQSAPLPLHMYGHGDGEFAMHPDSEKKEAIHMRQFYYLAQVASRGYFVVAHLSCVFSCGRGVPDESGIDSPFAKEIYPGQSDFLEILETVVHFESDPKYSSMIDMNASYTASGFNTGARAVLQIAALRDTPEYMRVQAPYIYERINARHLAVVRKVASVAALHPDAMYSYRINPDILYFEVSKTPVLVVTGTEDVTEPRDSAWRVFDKLITTPNKIFANFEGRGHAISPGYPALASRFSHAFSRVASGREDEAWDEWNTCVLSAEAGGRSDGRGGNGGSLEDGNGPLKIASGQARNSGGIARAHPYRFHPALMSHDEQRLGYYAGPSCIGSDC